MRVLSRKPMLNNDIDYFEGDLADAASSLDGFFKDVDVIFHCAGELKDESVMHALHVDGTKKLLQAAHTHINKTGKPLHWIQLSSVGAYGPPSKRANMPRIVTEATLTAPVGEYEVTKTLADHLVMQYSSMQPLLRYTILRPSIVIGNAMSNQSVLSLVAMIRRRLFFYIGSRSAIATYIHIDDVVDALLACAANKRAENQIFNVSNDCGWCEIVDEVARRAKIQSPRLCVPERVVRMLVSCASLFWQGPLTQERIDALVKQTHYPSTKLNEVIGLTPKRPIPHTFATLSQ
jgi:nucleoside-diphosphate-sugar epimerase